jgi:hypothetical protein
MKSWKVAFFPHKLNIINELARLTEFLRDFKAVSEDDDIYGDGQIDIDNIPAKYMTIMVLTYLMSILTV